MLREFRSQFFEPHPYSWMRSANSWSFMHRDTGRIWELDREIFRNKPFQCYWGSPLNWFLTETTKTFWGGEPSNPISSSRELDARVLGVWLLQSVPRSKFHDVCVQTLHLYILIFSLLLLIVLSSLLIDWVEKKYIERYQNEWLFPLTLTSIFRNFCFQLFSSYPWPF
jgi:hypothetical protein